MIGNPDWFRPRHFGWGLGIKKKEALAYIATFILIALVFAFSPIADEIKFPVIAFIIVLFLIDTLHIMTQVYARLDEREQKNQMLAETNASYIGVVCLTLYLGYVVVTAAMKNVAPDPAAITPIIIVMVMMALAKGGTLLYVEWKEVLQRKTD